MSIFGKRKGRDELPIDGSLTAVNFMLWGWELDKANGDFENATATRDRVLNANIGMFDKVHDTIAAMSHSGWDFSKDETVEEGLRASGYIAARERLLGA